MTATSNTFHPLIHLEINGSPTFEVPLPPSLIYLRTGDVNFSLDHLPPSLTHFNFSPMENNSSIDHLPSSLTHLTLGSQFNKPINNLPPSLTHLFVCSAFEQPMDALPHFLAHLSFYQAAFDLPLPLLPPSLTHLEFCRTQYSNFFPWVFPSSLTHLGYDRKGLTGHSSFSFFFFHSLSYFTH